MPRDVDYTALRHEQEDLVHQVRLEDAHGEIETVAGFDAAYDGETGIAALVVHRSHDLEPLEAHTVRMKVDLPYVPGYLAHREFPLLKRLWARKKHDVDLLLVDGAGTLHPRRMGSATYAGVKLDVPSIGVTKNLWIGTQEGACDEYQDDAPITEEGVLLGYAYRSSPRTTKPIYISPGHRVTPHTALRLVKQHCTGKNKLPEPLAKAHQLAGEAKRGRPGR